MVPIRAAKQMNCINNSDTYIKLSLMWNGMEKPRKRQHISKRIISSPNSNNNNVAWFSSITCFTCAAEHQICPSNLLCFRWFHMIRILSRNSMSMCLWTAGHPVFLLKVKGNCVSLCCSKSFYSSGKATEHCCEDLLVALVRSVTDVRSQTALQGRSVFNIFSILEGCAIAICSRIIAILIFCHGFDVSYVV